MQCKFLIFVSNWFFSWEKVLENAVSDKGTA